MGTSAEREGDIEVQVQHYLEMQVLGRTFPAHQPISQRNSPIGT